jgi:hypothetical protein
VPHDRRGQLRTVPREPARAGIDPYRQLIDRQDKDNIVEVRAATADSTQRSKAGATNE